MNALMDHQLRSLRERRPAICASVRFQLIMDPHVLRQVSLEHLVAHRAVERLYIVVKACQVLVEGVRTEEGLERDKLLSLHLMSY